MPPKRRRRSGSDGAPFQGASGRSATGRRHHGGRDMNRREARFDQRARGHTEDRSGRSNPMWLTHSVHPSRLPPCTTQTQTEDPRTPQRPSTKKDAGASEGSIDWCRYHPQHEYWRPGPRQDGRRGGRPSPTRRRRRSGARLGRAARPPGQRRAGLGPVVHPRARLRPDWLHGPAPR